VKKKLDPTLVGFITEDDVVTSDVLEFIPTLFPQMDRIMGGGWPVGRSVELFSPEGIGKSALMHLGCKGVQTVGGIAVFIDHEHSLDTQKIIQLGIDPKRLIYHAPDTIEQSLDILQSILETLAEDPPPAPVFIGWDSVAAGVPEAELNEDSVQDSHVGLVARAMAKGCRKLVGLLPAARACLVFVNQVRDKIGVMWGEKTDSPGGRAIKAFASIRIRLTHKKVLRQGEKATGQLVFAKTVKNRLAPPFQTASYLIDYARGPSPELSALQMLLESRVLKTSGVYLVPEWNHELRLKRSDWLTYMAEADFREKVTAAVQKLVEAGCTGGASTEE